MGGKVTVLGVFAVDAAYRGPSLPEPGQTVLGTGYSLGPGGKGSNQAVAAARAGAQVAFLSKVGRDGFAEIGRRLWAEAGIAAHVEVSDLPTGSAGIFVHAGTGENSIIVCPAAAGTIGPADIDAAADAITGAAVFVTQLEQPLAAAVHALRCARDAGVTTVLNPAPAAPLDDAELALCDWLVPNEGEAAALSGLPVGSMAQAVAAARALMARGAGGVVVTLGAQGAVVVTAEAATPVPAHTAGPVADTTGAGDCFTGAFAAALAEGRDAVAAARFAAVAAGISVTRLGAAASAPHRAEIDAALAAG